MRTRIEEVAQRANLFDLDLLAGFFLALLTRLSAFRILFHGRQNLRLKQPIIWMVSGGKPAACRAHAAGEAMSLLVFAQQGLRQNLGKVQLAYARAAVEQQCVRQTPVHVGKPIPHLILPRKIIY
jgi:hypothetical protein